MSNMRNLSNEEKMRLYEKYKDVLLPDTNCIKIIEYSYEELPDITFNMLAVLEDRENHFYNLSETHPGKGHGGTPNILDSSKGRQMYKRTQKHDKNMRSSFEKIEEQKNKIYNHTHRVITKKRNSIIRPGSESATSIVEEDLQRHEDAHELAKEWNKIAKKEETRSQLPDLYQKILKTGVNISFEVYLNDRWNGVYNLDSWTYDESVKSCVPQFSLNGNRNKIKRLKAKLEICKKADFGKTEEFKDSQHPAITAMQSDGLINQWKKHPELYFVKGYRKVAIRTFSKDSSKLSFPLNYMPNETERIEIENMAREYGGVFYNPNQ